MAFIKCPANGRYHLLYQATCEEGSGDAGVGAAGGETCGHPLPHSTLLHLAPSFTSPCATPFCSKYFDSYSINWVNVVANEATAKTGPSLMQPYDAVKDAATTTYLRDSVGTDAAARNHIKDIWVSTRAQHSALPRPARLAEWMTELLPTPARNMCRWSASKTRSLCSRRATR